ncbi:TetR/AcrR family transcriptional regulator [Ornithinibacillus bavariensis]|uniref:TetR family transcriptional regulator n=1 Tax=Ornithinibacillus bavariensis TaxID=545502 RepID=A0A919X6J3_9BACI|nr:TetR/AcrR family transcriptional regulator [Ornithinibacillus bavariensis]GIO25793.1 TetR family transcriptional regulator [Ornithinibacillus bavariensis]HAM79795.1 TetR/AcrR family transcriptional regulator [Ornithinibacillus sp.]
MKSDQIKTVALKYFTIHGYEGASLSQIAEEVGMKKQSIYAHFKGKDDLFLQVLHDAKENELSATRQYFNSLNSYNPKEDLYGFLRFVINLFQKSEQLKFWLRMSFFPPAHLAKEIEAEAVDIDEVVHELLENKFQTWLDASLLVGFSARTLTLAFLGVVDSIYLELVYGNDEKRLEEKLEASWKIYWKGISQR